MGLAFILLIGLLFAPQQAGASDTVEWVYTRHAGVAKPLQSTSQTLTTLRRDEEIMVSARQFCFALGCKLFYQWSNHRAVLQNATEGLGAIISSVTHVALVDGRIIPFRGMIRSEAQEGYVLPMDLAVKLAVALKLGHLERRIKKQPNTELAASKKTMLETIVIDPGHGGTDFGTSFEAIYEKDVALIYALKLRDEIKQELPDLDVFLTRENDQYVSLPDRAKLANTKGANLFLSIHVNHALDPRVEGVETYILSPDATDDEAKKVALLENDSWLRSANIKEAGTTVRKILIDMEQTKYIQDSALSASLIQQELVRLDRTRGLKSRGVKQAMFYVLSQVAMPSVLVEMGFLSSSGDRGRLMDVVFRDEFVKGVVSGLKRYRDKMVFLKEVSH